MLKRLFYRNDNEPFNVLMYPFLFQTFATGVAFLAFGWTSTVQASILYSLTSVNFGLLIASLWGIAAVLVTVLTLINLLYRAKLAGTIAGYAGLGIWIYAFLLYLLSGFVYQAVLTLPQIFFWVWHQYRITRYYNSL